MSDTEGARLQALRSYGILDTAPEEAFDRLTGLAAELLDAPMALISLLDDRRQWFKSRLGVSDPETPRAWAFCSQAMEMGPRATLVVEDATADARFVANPLVRGGPEIRFYAGATLVTPGGLCLGTLCVLDTKPRERPSDADLGRLRTLADIVVDQLELRLARERQSVVEAALAQSELRYRRLADNAPDIIAETLLDGTITYMSPAALAVTGVSPEAMVGRTSYDLMHPEDGPKLRSMCEAVIASRGAITPWPVEYRSRRADGTKIWLESKPGLVIDPATGEMIGMTDIIRDITVRKVLETELQAARLEAEAAAAVKSEFMANMSHELRTPLTSIVGFTQLAAEQADLTDLTRTYIDRVGDASRALLCTVNDILDFSKLEAGQVSIQPEPVSLLKLSRGALDLFTPQAGAKDIGLELACDAPADLMLMLDPDRVRQVLLNLVGNAVKFTQSGQVTLRARFDAAAERLMVDVIDTGAGVAPEKLTLLFQRFSQVDGSLTRAHGGTGLGLAICKGLVEAMGGEISVSSQVGKGSCFSFYIPSARATGAVSQTEAEVRERLSFLGVRVLVADDHPANRELARLFLAGVGAEVTEAQNGAEAAELAARRPYDVILMDMRMPELDGPGAVRRIRQGGGPNRSTPILAFTADVEDMSDAQMEVLGFQGLVGKPIDPSAMIGAIAAATVSTFAYLDDDSARAV
ncbi:ATP-binding protein [Phenylobacterium sp.]|uniref:hybrid sensor histidine kinase/response regulator n=1 Tax=Phenylobacterium sp. TaxID=1871053 RepID=UPI00286AE93E|nr:ATP-binding protein [Phenylobacterium sp.]